MRLALAWMIETPPIEPELSITKMTSRGSGFCCGLLDRRRRDEGEQIVAVADVLAEQPDRRRLLGGRLPGQLEIAIRRHRAFGKPDDARAGIGLFGLDRMMVALDLAEREAGLQPHGDAGRIDRRVRRGVEHFGRDAVAVRHGIGFGRAPAAAVGPEVDALHDRRGIVARRRPPSAPAARTRCRIAAPAPDIRSAPARFRRGRYWRPSW